MNDNRKDFLKKVSIADAAVLVAPTAFASDIKNNAPVPNVETPKTWLFQDDSITNGGRSYNLGWNHVYEQDYAYIITGRLNFDQPENDYKIFNRGIIGNT